MYETVKKEALLWCVFINIWYWKHIKRAASMVLMVIMNYGWGEVCYITKGSYFIP